MYKKVFNELIRIFNENNFHIYMIGGTSRDYLLGIPSNDFDFVTDATPQEMKRFIDGNYCFEKYGCVKTTILNQRVDITCMRIEYNYDDSRHPSKTEFVKSIFEDYKRRDFTVNAIYIDENYKVIDPSNGLVDLKNKVLRFIGDPFLRVQEDPLRIVRGDRFAKKLGFTYEEKTKIAIDLNRNLLEKLNQQKILEELKK